MLWYCTRQDLGKGWSKDATKWQINFRIFIFAGFQIAARAEIVPGRSVQTHGNLLQAVFGWHLILIPQRCTITSHLQPPCVLDSK